MEIFLKKTTKPDEAKPDEAKPKQIQSIILYGKNTSLPAILPALVLSATFTDQTTMYVY